MDVISRSIDSLSNDPNNARKHDDKNLRAIKGSLKKFGQQKPIVISDKGVVIAGNGTLEAARQLGWAEIDCVISALDNFNASAYSIADNHIATMSTWDDMILGSTLQSLREDGFDLGEIGFDTSALDDPIKSEIKEITGAKELGEDEFSEFEHSCPKCGFEFDGKK